MYKALYYLSRTIQVLIILFLIGLFSGIASEVKGIEDLKMPLENALIALFGFLVAPICAFSGLRYWVDPKLKARFNPKENVVEDRKE
jgi:hypothetical protein